MAFVVPVSAGSDWHCGWSVITDNMTIRIQQYRISVTFGDLDIYGTLLVEGTLVIEA